MRGLTTLCVLGLVGVVGAQDQPLLEPGSPVSANFRSEGRWSSRTALSRLRVAAVY